MNFKARASSHFTVRLPSQCYHISLCIKSPQQLILTNWYLVLSFIHVWNKKFKKILKEKRFSSWFAPLKLKLVQPLSDWSGIHIHMNISRTLLQILWWFFRILLFIPLELFNDIKINVKYSKLLEKQTGYGLIWWHDSSGAVRLNSISEQILISLGNFWRFCEERWQQRSGQFHFAT